MFINYESINPIAVTFIWVRVCNKAKQLTINFYGAIMIKKVFLTAMLFAIPFSPCQGKESKDIAIAEANRAPIIVEAGTVRLPIATREWLTEYITKVGKSPRIY